MYANINGTRLFFDVEGVGFVPEGPIVKEKPVCFVLHGGPGGEHTAYKPALSPLAEHMQLVYIDNRGSGRSAKGPQSTYTLENNVEDLEALRQYLGLEKIVLLGQSYGGMVALSYAAKYGEHLSGLLLLTTSPSHRFLEGAKRIVEERGTPEQKAICDVLWDGAFETGEQLQEFYRLMGPFYSYTYTEDLTEAELKQKEDVQKRSLRAYEPLNEGFGGFLKQYDVIDALPSISVPTLVIGSRHDWITPVEESFVIAEGIPDSELVIFENSSHSIFKDEYEHFKVTALDFIQRRLLGVAEEVAKAVSEESNV